MAYGVVLPVLAVSTHAPLAGSDAEERTQAVDDGVSTHAPLAGSDHLPQAQRVKHLAVSTHAPLAGSDVTSNGTPSKNTGFNPRSPCGERLDVRQEYY